MGRRLLCITGLVSLFVVLVAFIDGAQPTHAAGMIITVSTTLDVLDGNDGLCSLREAIIAANTDAASGLAVGECPAGNGADVINFVVTGTVYLQSKVSVTDSVEIRGPGVELLTLYANYSLGTSALGMSGAGEAFLVRDLHLSGNGIPGGFSLGFGSFAISNVVASYLGSPSALTIGSFITDGRTTVVDVISSTFLYNSAPGGAGIYNLGSGRVTLINSTVAYNYAGFGAAGILNTGHMAIVNSAIYSNTSNSRGGGIANSGVMTLTNSTVSFNQATGSAPNARGGGIHNSLGGVLTIESSTISHNSASNIGGGLDVLSATVALHNTIIANSSSGGDCNNNGGTVTNGGYLWLESTGCGISGRGDPLVGTLADNGGPTLTQALLSGSPAIDTGDPNYCAGATDQRGFFRLVDGNTDGNARCDIGAFEYNSFLFVPSSWVYLPAIRR